MINIVKNKYNRGGYIMGHAAGYGMDRPSARRKLKRRDPNRVKLGKRNRRSGRNFERNVFARLTSLGLPVYKVPMSGGLKATGLIPQLKDRMAGDLQITIADKTYLIECKHTSAKHKVVELAESVGACHIKGFCFMFTESDFINYLMGYPYNCTEVEDERHKWLHKYFDQDNSQLVVIGRNYKQNIYCVHESAMGVFSHILDKNGKFINKRS